MKSEYRYLGRTTGSGSRQKYTSDAKVVNGLISVIHFDSGDVLFYAPNEFNKMFTKTKI
jgi:hypothetical protein